MAHLIWPLLFGFRQRVTRGTYAKTGVTLFVAKYLVDALVIRRVTGVQWTPVDYLTPVYTLREQKLAQFPAWLAVSMVVWTLPFLWLGVSMTMRRAADAGRSPWLGLLFFIPFVNYVLMLALCAAPSAAEATWGEWDRTVDGPARFRSALLGIGTAIAVGLFGLAVNVWWAGSYGVSLFMATPFVLGAASGFVFNRGTAASVWSTLNVVALGLVLVAGTFIAFALEGVLCLFMGIPIGLALGGLGALIGRAIAIRGPRSLRGAALGALAIPVATAVDPSRGMPADASPTFVVSTAIEVDAPRDVVWRHVVEFDDIRGDPGLPFRLGLAYPVRARIAGRGVGAIRRCEFSTGAFVEPITTWDEPSRLAFDVTDQPPPLREWSPYQNVYAPHLHGFFRSKRGEFRLTELPGGRTRLEGRTWYQVDIHPRGYWRAISESIVTRIHRRVLEQVARESVADHATP